jgi:hypothetical protein
MAADALGILPDSWRQTGRLCASVYNAMGSGRAKEKDFMPHFDPPMADEQMEAMARVSLAAAGVKFVNAE